MKCSNRDELTEEHFQQFLTTQNPDATKIRELRHLFHAFVLDGELRQLIEQGDFARLRAHDAMLMQLIKQLGAETVKSVALYIRTTVPLDSLNKVA